MGSQIPLYPARKKPERVNAVWFGDHTPLDIFVITKRHKDGTFETARVWLTASPNSAFIAEAHPTTGLLVIEDDRLRIIQHFAEQRNQKRAVSNRLETLGKIVLKTDLVERGMRVPAIEERSYSQTIDYQRDKEHAIDDNRIPEELKEAALRYTSQTFSSETESASKPMKSFMQELGSSVSTKLNHL